MGPIPSWLDALAIRQDYLWFIVAAGWCVLLILSRPARLPGLTALGWAAVALALGEVCGMLLLADSSGRPAYEAEAVLGLVGCAPAVLLHLTGMTARFGRMAGLVSACVLTALLLVATTFRPNHPLAAVAVLNGVAVVAGWLGVASLRKHEPPGTLPPQWSWVLGLAVATVVLSSSGLVAEKIGWPRRSLNVSPMGLISACTQLSLLAAGATAWWLSVLRRGDATPVLANFRHATAFFIIWIAAGWFLVELAGHRAKLDFIDSLRARGRTCLGTLDRSGLEQSLGPDFQLVKIRESRAPPWTVLVADVPATLKPEFLPHQRRMEDLREENPDLSWVMISTLRQGWLINAALPFTNKRRRNGVISIERAATANDHQAWAAKQGYVEGPAWSPRGTFLTVAEPVTSPGGRMLGWLALKVDARKVLVAQSPARMLMGVTVGMGSMVAAGFFALRARGQAQRAARAQAAAAEAADRMKSALLAHVSHELRTPLQGILGYAELLTRHPLNDEQRGWLQAQQRQSQLLLRLVNDLIDLGALQSGNLSLAPRPGQLVALLEETILGLRPRAHLRQLTLEFEAEANVPAWLQFDPDRIRQVVLNLVGNAIKFTERGGVAVRLRQESTLPGGVVVEIAVADTGPGVAPAEQARLFQPFTRLETSRAVEGAGLGLAMTLGLCKAMSGSLVVESDGRTGSTFRARLQLGHAQPATAEKHPAAAKGLHQGLRVVVADDNRLVRELYQTHLASQGAACQGVADGREALSAARRLPPPDLLLLDLSMPHGDGIEVARQLRAAGPAGLCIIGISAHGNPEYRRRAMEAGMNDFLVKPVALDELSRCLQLHFGHQTGDSDSGLPAGLRDQLQATFQQEMPGLLEQLEAALARQDWPTVEARAHYLKSSAWVLEKHALADCCQTLCTAAQAGDEDEAAKQMAVVKRAVRA